MSARFLAVAATILFLHNASVGAAEITVLSAGGIRPPLEALIPEFERVSGHKVSIKFVGGPAVKTEIDGGAPFDVAVSTANVMEELVKAGKLAAGTRTDLARAGVGVAVRAGARKPNIASADALKRALLDAKSVAAAKDGTAGMHFQSVLERLGIGKEMEPKLKYTKAGDLANSAATLVARGEAELCVAAMATLIAPGLEVVGPLPGELQSYIHFSAAIGSGAKEPQAGVALLRFLTAAPAASAYKAKGMEPAPQR